MELPRISHLSLRCVRGAKNLRRASCISLKKFSSLSTAPHKRVFNLSLGGDWYGIRHDFRHRLGRPIKGRRHLVPFGTELYQLYP